MLTIVAAAVIAVIVYLIIVALGLPHVIGFVAALLILLAGVAEGLGWRGRV